MRVVMLVENNDRDGKQIKQWIETRVADVKVLWFNHPLEAEKKLDQLKSPGVIGCIVLDMFFPSTFTNKQEALGERILDRYPNIPTVLISKWPETRERERTQENVPLRQMSKPPTFYPAGNPKHKEEVEAFRNDLIEAVNCALLVSDLKEKVVKLGRSRVWQPTTGTRAGIAAIIFLAFVLIYAISIFYLSEFVQHLLLALSAVMGVHLLDHAVLLKDFREALESVRRQVMEVYVEVQRIRQGEKDDSARLIGDDEGVSSEGVTRIDVSDDGDTQSREDSN